MFDLVSRQALRINAVRAELSACFFCNVLTVTRNDITSAGSITELFQRVFCIVLDVIAQNQTSAVNAVLGHINKCSADGLFIAGNAVFIHQLVIACQNLIS